MTPQEYKRVFENEDSHGWYRGLHDLVLANIKIYSPSLSSYVLDLGCGTGGFLKQLQNICPLSYGIDISKHGLFYSKKRGLEHLIRGSAPHLPIKKDSIGTITCLDVIYHQQVQDDQMVLQECHRVLMPGGILILQVPAFSFLKRAHDDIVYTRERYTCRTLRQRLLNAQFQILKMTYRNMPSMPLILLKRLSHSQGSDLAPLPAVFNCLLLLMLKFENTILKYGQLPLGSSVFCIAKKPL